MAEESELSARSIAELRDRWKTAAGSVVRSSLLAALRAGDRRWPELLHDLPSVSTPAPYPKVLDDLRGLDFSTEALNGVSLTFSDLSYGSFLNCHLRKARFQGSKLSWANFANSRLLLADLLQVVADHAIFDRCRMVGAMMMAGDYKHTSFKGADLRRSVLNGCDFRESDLTGVDLLKAEAFDVKVPDSFDLEMHLRGRQGFAPR